MKHYRVYIYHPDDKETYVHWTIQAENMIDAMCIFSEQIKEKWNLSITVHIEIQEEKLSELPIL